MKDHCKKSCNGCTCAVSPRCEWGSESSNQSSEQTNCYTLGNCTSWPHCGSACAGEGFAYLKMSLDTSHKIIAQTSSKITSYPLKFSALTDVNHKKLKYRTHISLSLSQISEFLTWHFALIKLSMDWGKNRDFIVRKTFDQKRFGFMASEGGLNIDW